MPTRHLEYKDAKSDKFWEISLDGPRFTVRWGRRGSAGQSKTKELGSEDALDGIRDILSGGNGADRQLRVFNANRDLTEVVREIADATEAAAVPA